MRGISWAVSVVFLATAGGCAQAPPPPPPSYPAPTDLEARLAYADALQAGLREPGDPDEGPPEGAEEGYVEAMARGGRIARAEAAIENNDRILRSIASLSKAQPSGCVWTRLDLHDATGGADVDPGAYPAFAYRCSVRIVLDTERRGRV